MDSNLLARGFARYVADYLDMCSNEIVDEFMRENFNSEDSLDVIQSDDYKRVEKMVFGLRSDISNKLREC